MMTADEIFQAIQCLSEDERRRLLDRVTHEIGDVPPASTRQAAPPDRRAAVGMDAGKVWIAEDFDAPLPDEIQRAFEAVSSS
jgi:hypothetical protein